MHTFFINTSKKELAGYNVLFDIHYENKTLVSMRCLMSEWYDKNKGYITCVKQMSDMIDGYVELNNAFNLIIYVDLPEYKAYSSVPRDAFHDRERDECCRAMHILFTHIIRDSIVKELASSGRKPQNVLIMFGEEKKFTEFYVSANDPSRAGIMNRFFGFIGLPEIEAVENTAKEIQKTDEPDKVAHFKNRISEMCGEEIVLDLRDRYSDELWLWCDEIINGTNVPEANSALFERINSINKVEADRIGVEIVSCPYDCYACKVNKSVLALSELNVALYLLRCVELESALETKDNEMQRGPLEFCAYTVEEIAPILMAKKEIYAEQVAEIESLEKSYAELKLAPKLSAFDYAKFGLDMYGDKATEFVVSDVEPDNNEDKFDENNLRQAELDETIIVRGDSKEVSVVKKQGRVLLSKEEFQAFDYNYEEGCSQMLKKNTTPEEYIEQAKRVRKHHLDYLKKLKLHVSDALSNYAGKSKENKPALLQIGGYRYAAPGEENKALETVEGIAEKAYGSTVNQYMEFCATREVAISDIEEQCNWFVSRVNQIKESIKKIKWVAVGLLIAIIILYVPYVVIQFDAIKKNMHTILTALGSIGIPIALLYFISAVISAAQKKKYIKAWKEFEERSNQALKENRVAVQKYDQLLSVIIPALRWVYEYKLDVDYCVECCSVADAKIEHHRKKLLERVLAIQNILSDLEITETENEKPQHKKAYTKDVVDYNVSFCFGKKNCSFYTVIDSNALIQPKG